MIHNQYGPQAPVKYFKKWVNTVIRFYNVFKLNN